MKWFIHEAVPQKPLLFQRGNRRLVPAIFMIYLKKENIASFFDNFPWVWKTVKGKRKLPTEVRTCLILFDV